jgi:ribose transport system substrate-binding protein
MLTLKRSLKPLAAAMLALLCGAVRAAPAATFVMVPKSSSPYYQPCFEGFSAAAAKYGLAVRRIDPARPEAPVQAEVIQRLIGEHVDGIALSAIDDAGLAPVIAAAARAGVPVITFDSPAPSSVAQSYIGTDNRAAGLEAGKRLASLMKGAGRLLVLQGGLAAANLNLRAQGLREALAKTSVKVLEVVDISGDDAAAAAKTAEALRGHTEATAVFSVSSAGAPAAAEALARQGRAGKVLVAGFDDRPATLDGIRRGTVSFCVVQKTFKMGWLSVRALLAAAAGRKPPRKVDTGVVFVTGANVDTYVDEMRSEVTRPGGGR